MDISFQESRVASRAANFIFFTASSTRAELLGRCLDGLGRVDRLSGDAAYIARSSAVLKPSVTFVDFSVDTDLPPGQPAPETVVATLQRCIPETVLVGVGDTRDPAMTLLALRSGVADFIDLGEAPERVRALVVRLSERFNTSTRHAFTIAVAGARIGVGVSTLAAHLATLPMEDDGAPRRIALLDLGLPGGDGLLYTNTVAGFDFADAVMGLSRLDETLVHTALPVSPRGVSVLALPSDLGRMRLLPQDDAVVLIDQIRRYFDLVIVDLGGAGSADLLASVLALADARLVLTEQGIGSIVSLSELLQQLEERSLERGSLKLVVNRYDESYGMSAE
ncbi:MAG: AAA family ATPase, partial [Janthinobacterium lividum]